MKISWPRKEGRFAEVVNHGSQVLLCAACKPCFKVFAKMEVHGIEHIRTAENIKKKGSGVIFAINHLTDLDVIIVPSSFNFLASPLMPIHYVSMPKRDYAHFPGLRGVFWGGWLFTVLGAYPAYRGLETYNVSLRHHIDLLNAGKSVGIFPVGQKGEDWKPEDAKGGVAYLAEKTGAPIVPVKIEGLEHFTIKRFFSGKHRIVVSFGKPIDTQHIFEQVDSLGNKYQKAAKRLMEMSPWGNANMPYVG